MGCVGGMAYGNMGKPPYVVWYVLTLWDGKNTVPGTWYTVSYVCGMVPWYDVVDVLYS